MERFCVITNSDKDENYELAQHIQKHLIQHHKVCHILDNQLQMVDGIRHFTDKSRIPQDTQCALVLGGDGTMIQAAIDLVDRSLPILGVNIGTIGFLTEIEQQDIIGALDRLMNNQYTIENRIMLRETTLEQKYPGESARSCYALNDMVISKRGACRLITIKVYINGELADTYRADGLIVATPTGSTGYNLSAGGPVMVPHTHATVITPICPHSLNKRSLVLSASDRIQLEIGQTKEMQEDEAVLTVDGRNAGDLVSGDKLLIQVPESMTQLIKLTDISFYKRMREKL